MAQVKWTEEQKRILDADGNLIVSAAAGSGKTAVLTERIAEKVSCGTDICDMLVVTFTTAAAAEMKQRIEKKLYERSQAENDEEKRSYLYSQALNTQRANISTLHAFCTYVLRRHFYELDMPPAFRVGDAAELTMLREEALDEALNLFFTENAEKSTLLDFVQGERNLVDIIDEIYDAMRVSCDGREWLHNAVEGYNITDAELKDSSIMKELAEYTKGYANLALEYVNKSVALTENERQHEILKERHDYLSSLCATASDYDACRGILGGSLRDFRGQRNMSEKFKAYSGFSNECVKLIKGFYELSLHENAELIRSAYKNMREIESIVLKYDELYAEKKKKRAVIDFSDMEQLTLQLLRKPHIAQIYRDKFKYVFVDEYQDINRVQDEIIKHILQKDNAFFVGDVKQSIYRFRHAKPTLFLEKMERYEKEKDSDCMSLGANFRSSDAVVEFVNMAFSELMNGKTSGIEYDDKSRLKKMSACGKGRACVHYIESAACDISVDEEDESDPARLMFSQAQAALAAKIIKQKIKEEKFFDPVAGKVRSYTFSDFAIIMRSVKNSGDMFARELTLEGIPVYLESGGGYFSAVEIQIFVNLLKIIDNRRQDIPLLSVMRSVIGGFSFEELAAMRNMTDTGLSEGRKKSFFDTLVFASKSSEDIGIKARNFLEKLDLWYELSRLLPLEEFVRRLYDDTGYYRFVAALPEGRERANNLDEFARFVQSYEGSINKGLYDFLKYLESASEHCDLSVSRGAADNAVSILTMHKSKGLEYNVVIVPELERRTVSVSPARAYMLFDEEPIIGTKSSFNGVVSQNIFYKVLAERSSRALIADELRLLYVVLTRAKDTLIMTASVDSIDNMLLKNSVSDGRKNAHILKSSSRYIDWITLALVNSGYERMIKEAAVSGVAEDELFTVRATPHFAYKLAEKKTDTEFFREKLELLKTLDTSEQEAEFAWRYPYFEDTLIAAKGSVTGFAHPLAVVSYTRHTGESEGAVFAAGRGTATHLVFEKIPLQMHTKKSVSDFVKKLVLSGELSEQDASAINISGITAFFTRPLYERMLKSKVILREKEFACFAEANMLSREYTSCERVLVQGVIDCCFLEGDEWVIVDYKTDRVASLLPLDVTEKAMSHKKQLELYAYMLEKLTGKRVKEGYVVLVNAWDVRVI